jgi:hypothetical protein
MYKKKAKRLRQTGGGLGGNDELAEGGIEVDEFLDCYIPPDGPDATTTDDARNIWGMFFFLHIFPNVNIKNYRTDQ